MHFVGFITSHISFLLLLVADSSGAVQITMNPSNMILMSCRLCSLLLCDPRSGYNGLSLDRYSLACYLSCILALHSALSAWIIVLPNIWAGMPAPCKDKCLYGIDFQGLDHEISKLYVMNRPASLIHTNHKDTALKLSISTREACFQS